MPGFIQYRAAFNTNKSLSVSCPHIGRRGRIVRTVIPGNDTRALVVLDANRGLTGDFHGLLYPWEYSVHLSHKTQILILSFGDYLFQIVAVITPGQTFD